MGATKGPLGQPGREPVKIRQTKLEAFVIAALAMAWPAPPAHGAVGDAATTAETIAECIAGNAPQLSAVHSLAIEVRDAEGELSITRARVSWRRFGDVGRLLVAIEEPEDLAGCELLVVPQAAGRPAAWVYLPELGKAKRVRSAVQVRSVIRGDMQFEEVRRLFDLSHGTELTLVGETEVDGRAVWQVEARPEAGRSSYYDRFDALVDREFCLPLRVDFLSGGAVTKRMSLAPAEVVRVAESWLPRLLHVEDLEIGSMSTLRIDEIQLEVPLPPRMFTPEALSGTEP